MNLNGRTINPGQLRTHLTLKRRTVSMETGGFPTPAYATIAAVWARWTGAHGSEVWAAAAAQAVQPATALIRYLPGLDTSCVVELDDGQIFEVVSIDDIELRHEYIELKCQRMGAG